MIWLIIVVACVGFVLLSKIERDMNQNDIAKKTADELERRQKKEDNQKKE